MHHEKDQNPFRARFNPSCGYNLVVDNVCKCNPLINCSVNLAVERRLTPPSRMRNCFIIIVLISP
jgi:hypothetical protein